MAMLVNRLVGMKSPPKDTSSVDALREERIEASIGPVGLWLRDRLQVTT